MGTFVYRARRREMRRALGLTCEVVREHDFRRVGGEALDISPDGMLVRVSESLPLGESLIVSFRVPRIGLYFDTDATVSRVLRGRRARDVRGQALGLSFGSLDAVSRLILRGALRSYPPPLPRRAQPVDFAATVGRILSMPDRRCA